MCLSSAKCSIFVHISRKICPIYWTLGKSVDLFVDLVLDLEALAATRILSILFARKPKTFANLLTYLTYRLPRNVPGPNL